MWLWLKKNTHTWSAVGSCPQEQVLILVQIGAGEPGRWILLGPVMDGCFVAKRNFNFIYFKWGVPADCYPYRVCGNGEGTLWPQLKWTAMLKPSFICSLAPWMLLSGSWVPGYTESNRIRFLSMRSSLSSWGDRHIIAYHKDLRYKFNVKNMKRILLDHRKSS